MDFTQRLKQRLLKMDEKQVAILLAITAFYVTRVCMPFENLSQPQHTVTNPSSESTTKYV